MTIPYDPTVLPSELPVPQDDGATRHLAGMKLPALALVGTDGSVVDLSSLRGRTIVYVYPRTGRPNVSMPDGWDAIPGARGCTPQSCSFRDHFAELKQLGVAHVFGLSTQESDYQREAGGAVASAVPGAVRRRADADACPESADLHRRGHDPAQADGVRDRRWRDDQGVLSGVSAGQERRRGRCVATQRMIPKSGNRFSEKIMRKRYNRRGRRAPPRTPRGTSPASARGCSCCSASSDSC